MAIRKQEYPARDEVYFAQEIDMVDENHRGPIKIGFTRRLDRRIEQLNRGVARPVVIVGFLPGTREMERKLHRRFALWRMRGEWFEPSPELLAFIQTACRTDDTETRTVTT